MNRPTEDLSAAVAALVDVGTAAGLDDSAVRSEAASFAAALCETAPGAAAEWAGAVGTDAGTLAGRATAGRDWRRHPTPILRSLVTSGSRHAAAYATALAQVASAACSLGDPTLRVIDVATFAADAQLRAAGVGPAALTPANGAELLARGVQAGAPDGSAGGTGHDGAGQGPSLAVAPPAAAAPSPGLPPARPLEDLLAELDALVGLERVKVEVRRQAELMRVTSLRTTKGLRAPDITRHLVFVGNPGTGKTTVARLVAAIYRSLGVLAGGQLVECDRSTLVAGYVGQTAIKTAEVATSAHGGVLFIDEAYSLAGDEFGREAIETIVKQMEDHRDELIVIVAGYPEPMADFIDANPGLESRFRLTMRFEDYRDDELVTIFERIAAGADFTPSPGCLDRLRSILATTPRDEGFGNARFVRNLFEAAVVRQAWRLREVADPTVEQLRALDADDLDTGQPDVLTPPPGVADPSPAVDLSPAMIEDPDPIASDGNGARP